MYSASVLSKELIAASTRPLLLSILQQGDSYGYALVQRVKELSEGEIEWSEGMLYPVLHRLEEEGLIAGEWRQSETGKKRKYYSLRDLGQKALFREKQQWNLINTALKRLWQANPSLT